MRWQELVEPQDAVWPVAVPKPRGAARRARRIALVVATTTLGACAVSGMKLIVWSKARDTALRLVQPSGEGAQVQLCGTSAERKLGFVTVTGSVKNRTVQLLGHVEAVVELKDARHNTVAVESALLSLDPLKAGETSPFQVEMEDQPRAVEYRIHFRRLLGATLD